MVNGEVVLRGGGVTNGRYWGRRLTEGRYWGGGDYTAPLHVTAGMLEPDKWDV